MMPKKVANKNPQNPNCVGDNVSPELSWKGVPDGTKSFAFTMVDPEARGGLGVFHWVAYGIPANVTSFAEGEVSQQSPKYVGGKSTQGVGFFSGPCTPPGSPHHYTYMVIATDLDASALPAGLTLPELQAKLAGHQRRCRPRRPVCQTGISRPLSYYSLETDPGSPRDRFFVSRPARDGRPRSSARHQAQRSRESKFPLPSWAPRAGKWARGCRSYIREAGAGAGVVLITAGRAADADGAIVSLPTLIGRPPCAVTSWVSKTTGIEPSSGNSLAKSAVELAVGRRVRLAAATPYSRRRHRR